MNDDRRAALVLGLILVVGLAVRTWALGAEGHNGDVRVMAGWAERMAEVGPWRFYEGSGAVYPALLYPLWMLGWLFDGPALAGAIEALSIPFDVALAVGLAALAWRPGGPWRATAAAGLYFLNPAAVLAGPVWGQVDSAGSVALVASLAAAARGRHGWAAALAMVAGLVKPQFGLVAIPVLTVACLEARREARLRPVLDALGGALAAYVLIAAPLALHPPRYLGILADTATRQPMTSLHAFNPWGLLVGFDVPDDPYVLAGSLLLLAGIGASLLLLRGRRDLTAMLAAGAALVLAFYFLPTRVHERYLYPAIAVLAPLAASGRRALAAYVALSVGFAASLVYALLATTPFSLPPPVEEAVLSDPGRWAIGVVLIGSAAWWGWLLAVRRPRLRPGRTREPVAGR